MQYLFRDAAHLTLLRTTGEQIHRGVKVEEFSLKTGDLVFFQTGEYLRHVGVYIGDNQFIHASSSQGSPFLIWAMSTGNRTSSLPVG